MNWITNAVEGLSGQPSELEQLGPASRLMLVATALLTAAACSAFYGLAVGTTPAGLALTNVIKLPVVVVLSGLFALPMGALVVRVFGSPIDATQLWLSQATGTLTASLVLAAVAPLVGLFYFSSDGFGGIVAVVSAFGAIAAGLFVFARSVRARVPQGKGGAVFVPAATLVLLQGLAVMQLVAVASPILPEVTPFAAGIDAFVGK